VALAKDWVEIAKRWVEIAKRWVEIAKAWVEIARPKRNGVRGRQIKKIMSHS
jgi:hypothetical protein